MTLVFVAKNTLYGLIQNDFGNMYFSTIKFYQSITTINLTDLTIHIKYLVLVVFCNDRYS